MGSDSNQRRMPTVICYGGTFDPPHLGHQDAVKILNHQFPDAQVLVMPALAAPLAHQKQAKASGATFTQRLTMTQLNFTGLPRVHVSDLEQQLPTPNYTVQTLAMLKRGQPRESLAWVMGTDQWQQFTGWREPQQILDLATVLVMPRRGYDVTTAEREQVLAAIDADDEWHSDGNWYRSKKDRQVFFMTRAPREMASTTIRELIKQQSPIVTKYLDSMVAEYIYHQKLYLG